MIERFERFTLMIADISRSWHKIAGDVMEEHGLKGSHALYLTTLVQHPDGLTAPKIGELCDKDKADVSRTMALLESKGLARKEYANPSGYGGLWRLTEAGEKAACHVFQLAQSAVETASKGLTPERRVLLYEALDLIADNLRNISINGLS